FPISQPVYIDRRGVLWITRADAEETDTLLTSASSRQVNLTRERVLFAHWFYNEGGDWIINLVTRAASGNGSQIITSKGRQAIGVGDDYDWSRAFSIPAQRTIIVP